MSVFQPNGALISIGGAILYTIGGLNPQRITTESESRVPGHPVPSGMDYQLTGMGEKVTTLEARTWPHVMGGLDALQILRAHHEAQNEVNFIRLHGNYIGQLANGPVVIQTLEADEEKLHPHDGVGRIVDVSLTLIHLPFRSLFAGFGL